MYVKYPRTPHMPWSEGVTDDDKIQHDMSWFENRDVVVTVKMDGENTSMYCDHIHARSVDSRHHPSRTWVKNFWAGICNEIPEGWRICGENVFAKHSISYEDLKSYFLGFSIWNEQNICLSWPKTLAWFEALNITPVPILYVGKYNEQLIREIGKLNVDKGEEGYVIRPVDCFQFADFNKRVVKYVRKNHVQTEKHWMHNSVIQNKLKSE